MVVGHDRRADPLCSAQGSELSKRLIELAGAGAARQEEVELLSTQGNTLACEGDSFDGGGRRSRLQGQPHQPQPDALVPGRRGHPDPPILSSPALEPERESKLGTAERPQLEPSGET
jgi:hypothetical protein